MKNKLMFTYLKTGGGHYSPAKALSDYIITQKPDTYETILVDGLFRSSKFAKLILEGGYRFLQNNAPWLYETIYYFHKIKVVAAISNWLVSLNTKKYLTEIMQKEKPDTIVILHFFMIKPIFEIITSKKNNAKVVIVVTDPYSAPPLWLVNKNASFIVFSNILKSKFIEEGVLESNISVFPFVVNSKYSNALDSTSVKTIKQSNSLNYEKTVLIIGGADGLKNGKKLIIEINKKVKRVNQIIVCGRNQKLYKEVSALKKRMGLDNLLVFGFAENVYELINTADIVISKCGASTIMEILLLKKVPIINSYLWEQEKGNMEYVVNNNFGYYIQDSRIAAAKVFEILQNNDLYKELEANIKNADLQNGLPEVASFIQKITT